MIKHRAAARTTPSVRKRSGRAGLRKDRSSEASNGLQGIAEWEAMKAARRNLSHADAVDECSYLSNQYRGMWRAMTKFEVDLRLVVEVAFGGIQESPRYPGGLALRFARVKRYRPEKPAAEADTIQTVMDLFHKQRE